MCSSHKQHKQTNNNLYSFTNMRLIFLLVLVQTWLLLGHSSAQVTCDPNSAYRSISGACNNLRDPTMGTPGRLLSRGIEGAEFEDGVSVPYNLSRPNERAVSNALCRTDVTKTDPNRHSMFASHFGQFVNHDLEDTRTMHTHPQDFVFDVAIWITEWDDSHCFGPVSATNSTIRNYCATGVPQRFRLKSSDGRIVHNRYEVPNEVTSWLDLSTIYGSTDADADVLRTHSGGRLLTQDYSGILPVAAGPGYPPNTPYYIEDMPPSAAVTGLPLGTNAFTPFLLNNLTLDVFFSSGDMRLNENVGLLAFHVLFTREHNRLADRIRSRNPFWNDEKIYQEARKRNIAQYQNFVLYQYLPSIIGQYHAAKIGPYRGYNPDVNVDTDNAFASAAFRYGHFTLRSWIARDACGRGVLRGAPSNETVPFMGQLGGFNSPLWNIFRPGNMENTFRGLISTLGAPVSPGSAPQIRDIQFRPGGTDIISIDLKRARLNGIPNYARLKDAYNQGQDRLIYGLPGCPEWYQREPTLDDPIECLNHITDNNTNTVSPPENSLAYKLRKVYQKVNRIDALIGLVAEKHPEGSSFPTTLANMIISTYDKLRAGDRFWFEKIYAGLELWDIKHTTIGDIIRRNFPDIGVVPDNPFIVPNNYLRLLAWTCDK